MREAGEACFVNIGPQQRRQRMAFGVVMLAIGLVLYAAMMTARVSPAWFAALFLPFAGGGFGIFQAVDKT